MCDFKKLYEIDVNERTEKKGKMTYLSWAWAWAEVKKVYPDAMYEIKKFENGLPYLHDVNTGYMVMTTVTIKELTYEMWLPVMDYSNKAMMKATMTDINKAIMRCLTKNLAMFGLGLYIYAGEDLPEQSDEAKTVKAEIKKEEKKDLKVEIKKMLCEIYNFKTKEDLKNYEEVLENLSQFTNKDGVVVAGVKDLTKLSDARLKTIYGTVKKMYEEQQKSA